MSIFEVWLCGVYGVCMKRLCSIYEEFVQSMWDVFCMYLVFEVCFFRICECVLCKKGTSDIYSEGLHTK